MTQKRESINLRTFRVAKRKIATGVSPQARERLDIPAKNVVRFRAGKELKEKGK